MEWVSVKDRLPEDRAAVLVRRNRDNWEYRHHLGDGTQGVVWRWQAAVFRRGRTAVEVAMRGTSSFEDQSHSNTVPFAWDLIGPGYLFGQEVSHWAAITEPLEVLK